MRIQSENRFTTETVYGIDDSWFSAYRNGTLHRVWYVRTNQKREENVRFFNGIIVFTFLKQIFSKTNLLVGGKILYSCLGTRVVFNEYDILNKNNF